MTRTWTLSVVVAILGYSPATLAQADLKEIYFGDRELSPDEHEETALAVLENSRPTGPTGKPVLIGEKAVQFVFGVGTPTLICAPSRACAIVLEPGETVRGKPVLPDKQWKVTYRLAGEPGSGQEVVHIYVEPKDIGLQTTIAFTTTRRSYELQLASHSTKYMARVSFSYPDDEQDQRWRQFEAEQGRAVGGAARPRESRAPSHPTTPSGLHLNNLSFAYEMEGDEDAPWRPERIYNDGVKTIVEFPASIRQMQMPGLVGIRFEGGLFTDDEAEPLNSRVHGRLLKIDGVPNVFDLVQGVGSTQVKIRIRRVAED